MQPAACACLVAPERHDMMWLGGNNWSFVGSVNSSSKRGAPCLCLAPELRQEMAGGDTTSWVVDQSRAEPRSAFWGQLISLSVGHDVPVEMGSGSLC